MNSTNTIAAQWESFQALAMPATAPSIQRLEMRLAFYAGATALLGITQRIGEKDISDSAGVALLQSLHEEAEAFAISLLKGAR